MGPSMSRFEFSGSVPPILLGGKTACMGPSMSRFEFSGSVPPILLGGKTATSLYGAIHVKVRVQRQRSSDFVGREDGYELIQSEGSSPSGAGHRAASLYPVGLVGPEP